MRVKTPWEILENFEDTPKLVANYKPPDLTLKNLVNFVVKRTVCNRKIKKL
jgi:hypothetical protein